MTHSALIHFEAIRAAFAEAGDPLVAEQQMAYMKGHFEFFGLKMPVWTSLARQHIDLYGLPQEEVLTELIHLCFADDHRELHYFALQCLEKQWKRKPESAIVLLEQLIQTQSWWDSVDWINKLVGQHFKRFPHLVVPTTERWMTSGNKWLQRVCLIFQLTYRQQTDAPLMFKYIRQVAHSKEFFLQKAAGWALRQYSKSNPEAVRQFLAEEKLAPLTRREAGKYL
jgi:3-methyladenine DNA glycosylase AlkD